MVGDTYDLDREGKIKYPKPTSSIGQQPTPTNPVNVMAQPQPKPRPANFKEPEGWNADKEAAFQDKIKNHPDYKPWYDAFVQRYGEAPYLGLDADYNYRLAIDRGVKPVPDPYDNNILHCNSASGDITLKATDHPDRWKEDFMRQFGYNPDRDKITKQQAEQMMRKQK